MADEQKHWSAEFEHESLVEPQARESFTKAMSKYETPEAAIIGGFNAIKEVGKPFKLPEDMANIEKWPDPKDRDAFRAGLNKLLGAVEKPEDLKDIKWLEGSKREKPDEKLVSAFSQFAAANKIPKSLAQKLIGLWNSFMTAAEEANAQAEAQLHKAANEQYLAMYDNDPEKLKVATELLKRMFLNNAGLSAEDYEAAADEFIDKGGISKYPVIGRALLKLAENFREGSTVEGNGVPPPPPPEEPTIKDKYPKTAAALGWKAQKTKK